MKRETGYYWIKLKNGNWIIAQWLGIGCWMCAFLPESPYFEEQNVSEVNENRIKSPDEPRVIKTEEGIAIPFTALKDALDKLKKDYQENIDDFGKELGI